VGWREPLLASLFSFGQGRVYPTPKKPVLAFGTWESRKSEQEKVRAITAELFLLQEKFRL